ncbi:MAG: ChaN family lipoprotein [Elusimicrobiota bacterium]|nr:ChaN family lipoprotein [Elusimicrobiota bacterium]
MKLFIFSILFLLPLTAYSASVKKPEANIEKRAPLINAAAPVVLTQDKPNFCIIGARSGKDFRGEAAFKSIVWKSDVVYVGETHDEPLDHMAQLEALKAMRIARGSKIAVGFEMVVSTLQPVLDDYAAGKITEDEFREKANWKTGKGFDFSLYKPLFDFIIQHKLRALALNVPRAVVKKIARTGLESLTPEEKQHLPPDFTVTKHKKYNDYLKESFSSHGSTSTVNTFAFDNYLASMAAWNEGMGSRIVSFLNENPGYSFLVIAGNGHIIYNAAIPASVKARLKGVRQASFLTENALKCPETMPKEHKDMANYIWYINHAPKPEPAINISTATPVLPALSTAPLSPSPAPAAEPGR